MASRAKPSPGWLGDHFAALVVTKWGGYHEPPEVTETPALAWHR